jgi:hypothetical protein
VTGNGERSRSETGGCGYAVMSAAGGRYLIRIASTREELSAAFDLAFGSVLGPDCERLVPGHMRPSIFHAIPTTVTFIAERQALTTEGNGAAAVEDKASSGRRDVVATLSLAPDSPLGLPMDESFAEATDAMRKEGRKPCELFELVVNVSDRQAVRELLMSMFRAAWLYAAEIAGATDLCIAVMPRHENFFRRRLLFHRSPSAPPIGRHDNAPVVFLSLDLEKARQRYLERYGSDESPGNLYRFFVACDEAEIVDRMRRLRRELSPEDLRYFLVERTGILRKTTRQQIDCLRKFYPGLDFDALMKVE